MKKQSLLLMLVSVAALCAGCQQGGFNSTTGSNEISTGTPTTVSPTTVSPTTATPTTPTPTTPTPTTAMATTSVTVPEITVDEFESVITTATSKSDSIASGTVKYKNIGYYPIDVTLAYQLGTDTLYYQKANYDNSLTDIYAIRDGSDIVVVEKDSSGNYSKSWTTFSDVLNFPYENVLGYSFDTCYGIENLISSLFACGKENVNKDFEFELKDDTYSFAFNYWKLGYGSTPSQLFDLKVSFKLGNESELSNASVEVNMYYSSSFIFDTELNIVYLTDDAEINETISYEVSQVVGTRNYTCPVQLSDFYAESFDLMFKGEEVTSETTISIVNEEYVSLLMDNVLPATTSFDFDECEINIVEGEEYGISGYAYNEIVTISASIVGNYVVEIKTKNVTKTFKVEVTEALPTSITYFYSPIKPDGSYDTIMVNDDVINGYINNEYILTANVLPSNAEQGYTCEVVSDNKDSATLITREFALSETADLTDHWCFSASKEGTYTVRISSTVVNDVYRDITFKIGAKPSFSSVLSSDEFAYVDYGGISYLFDFTPSASDDNSGTVVITDYASSDTETASYSISKAENGYNVALTHISGEEFKFTLAMTDSFDLYVYFEYEGGEGSSYEKLSVVSPELYLCGNWSGEIEDKELNLEMYIYNDRRVSITIYGNGIYQSGFGSITLTESDNGYTGSIEAVEVYDGCTIVFPITITVDKDFTSISLKLVVGEETYNFTLSIYVYEY